MSFGAVVIGGAALAGSVISSSSARSASRDAANSEQAQLAFAQEQYDDWQAIYGPVQENLAGYFNSLTPEYYESVGLEAIEGEFTRIRDDIDRSLAQRGISSDSGLALQLERETGIDEAEARAQVRREAPAAVAQDQLNFLAVGQGSNPTNLVSGALSQSASGARSRANQAQAAAGQSIQDTIQIIGTGLSDYLTGS